MDSRSILPRWTLAETPKCCSREGHGEPPELFRERRANHNQSAILVSPDCLCFERPTSLESSCNLYPQIAEYMMRAFGKSLCYNYRYLNTHRTSHQVHNPQTNAIFMYRLRWVYVPWSSPYKTDLAGKKSDFMSWSLFPMPTAIFMNRLLMVILRI